MNQIINIKNLSFEYPDGTKALEGINFSIDKGKCVAVLGANGSGKTTLLYHLIGVIPHIFSGELSGEIEVTGMDMLDSNIYEITQKVSIVQQDPDAQILFTTVEAECAFAPSNFGIEKEEIENRIKWALKVTGLEGFKEKPPDTLSYGQKQRLAIAASLTIKPEILLLDEPFSNIDSVGKKEILSVLKRLKQENKLTIVISTHDISEIAEIVDYVLLLSREGKQLTFDELHEVFKHIHLIEKARVNIPPLTNLTMKLGVSPAPLTLKESYATLSNLLDKGLLKVASQTKRINEISNHKDILLETLSLTHVYTNGNDALKDINLKIYNGDFVGIIGQNGSGKTTLIKHFVGLLKPTKGEVFFNGRSIQKFTIGELSRDIGIALQNPEHQLLHAKTVFDEIAFGLRKRHVEEEKINSLVQQAIKIVGLEEKQDVYPAKLSFGEKKKLMLACIVAMDPQVIILDEPFFGLDYFGKINFVELLKSLNTKGYTIVVVTHNMDIIAEYASRLVVMFEGKIVLDGHTTSILDDISLEKYGIEVPQIVKLTHSLKEYGIPICYTINEMLKLLER